MKYVGSDYWRSLHGRSDLSSVGQADLSGTFNTWIYRTIGRNLRRLARRHGLDAGRSRRMLEVGVGTGYWIDLWEGYGWQVDGCDLVPAAVDKLRRERPSSRFWVTDASAEGGILAPSGGLAQETGYDLVTCTSVLLHITRPRDFQRALANAAQAVRPGGHLLLVEPVLTATRVQAPYDPNKTSRARVLRSYVKPLTALGLELIAVEATTVLAANPLEATSPRRLRAYHWWWRQVVRSRRQHWLARVLGPVMYTLDPLLMRTGEAPTSKVLLFRKSG